jgi:hypothetical protein
MSNTFKPGQSGNPAGRPKGSRNSLADAFLSDLQREWVSYGSESTKKMGEDRPANFVRVVASVMPKILETNNSLQDMSTRNAVATVLTALGVLFFTIPTIGIRLRVRKTARALLWLNHNKSRDGDGHTVDPWGYQNLINELLEQRGVKQ